ncbi:hypothetical protein J2X20_003967 [Pelomonas saccharophila]|uniref:Uncharacterized protein n=1 Tax=Roseateles saccharophilus TaxID=304 RepID=A0ABU1YR11_ROSSA|nr:hypothetical protein [Roseateles saccharophilus]MDR7271299.1 hypothetical protein [Roseateles saccharophilus]
MNTLPRWISLASFAAVLVLATTGARAFTDSNAELKEAAAERADRVVVVGKAARPVQTAWVPAAPKSLDGFRPVFPNDPVVVARHRPMLVAKADVSASATKR